MLEEDLLLLPHTLHLSDPSLLHLEAGIDKSSNRGFVLDIQVKEVRHSAYMFQTSVQNYRAVRDLVSS